MNYFSTRFAAYSQDKHLRSDAKYHRAMASVGNNLFSTPMTDNIALSDILIEEYNSFDYDDSTVYKGIPTGQAYIDEDGYITDWQSVTAEDHPGRLKYAASADNLLISSIRLAKSPALNFDIDNLDEYVFSNGFYFFRVKNGWDKRFVLYLLRSKRIKGFIDNNIYRGIGISAYRAEDLLKIEIKELDIDEQEKALIEIRPFEKTIQELKNQIKIPQSIINEVFAREFGFDYDKFKELKTHTRFSTGLSVFANNPDMRFSAKFHRDAGAFVMEQLSSITNKKIKHYLAEPIVLGSSVSPDDYSDDGDYYYISMATIKSWAFDPEGANLLKTAYVNSKQDKTVRKNDILLARSGEGTIGKVALIDDEDMQGVFADFTMRIRLANYNPLFAYYYFRTTFFQYLVEVYKKGLGNNTNIFPIVIREFPIPDISLDEQRHIVDEIQMEINKQDSIKEQITDLRGKIDAIIENALTQIIELSGNYK